MTNLTLLFFVLSITLVGYSQKVKIKDDIATVDKVDYLKWDKKIAENAASISSLTSDHEEVYALYLSYNDASNISSGNPNGAVRWIEINFLDLGLKCEVSTRSNKRLALLFYESKLYVDGILNEDNVRRFVAKYGMRYSDNRPNGNVIIINNN